MNAIPIVIGAVSGLAFSIWFSAQAKKVIEEKVKTKSIEELTSSKNSSSYMALCVRGTQIGAVVLVATYLLPKFENNAFLMGIFIFCILAMGGTSSIFSHLKNASTTELELRTMK